MNNDIRKWEIIGRQVFTLPTQEKCFYYQVNYTFTEKDYSLKKIYFRSNYCNITSERILKFNVVKAKDHFYYLYHYSPLLSPILIKELYSNTDII